MPVFSYQARGRGGTPISGEIEANNRGHAMVLLRERGLAVDSLVDARQRARQAKARWGQGPLYPLWPVRATSLALFFDQLGRLLSAGVTPHEAFSALQERVGGRLRRVAREGAAALASGESISTHLARYPRFFPPHVVGIMRAGELSGALGEACREIAVQFETEVSVRRYVAFYKAYLGFFVVLCILVPSFPGIISHVNPTGATGSGGGLIGLDLSFRAIMDTLRPGLQWYGRHVLYDIVPWLVGAWVLMKVVVVLSNLPVTAGLRDSFLLYTPGIGAATRRAAVARFTRTFELMQRAAVPLADAVREAGAATGNSIIARRLAAPAAALRSGGNVREVLRAAGIFSPSQLSVLSTAQDTGTLDDALSQLSEKTRTERGNFLKVVGGAGCIMAPILLAALVLFSALAGYIAIYKNIEQTFGGDAWQP